jgi:hypothetical protein
MFGAIVGAIGAVASANAQARAQKAQGEVAKREAEYNAKIYENRAKSIEFAMQAESARMISNQRRAQATQEVMAASMGARIDEGTPLNVMLEQVELMALDVNNLRRNRMIEATHERAGKEMTLYQGENALYLAKQKANATRQAGLMSGLGKLASGVKFGQFTFNDPTAGVTPVLPNAPMGYFDSFSGNYSSIG